MKEEKDMYEVMHIFSNMYPNRNRFFWKEITTDKVVEYKKQLLTLKEWLDRSFYNVNKLFNVSSREHFDKICEEELALCNFYLSYPALTRHPDFDKWVFKDDCHSRTNGRIKVIIELTKNTASTKIVLSVLNDNKYLKFYNDGYSYSVLSEKNLRSPDSIAAEVTRLKQYADLEIFSKYLFPRYYPIHEEYKTFKQLIRVVEI